MNRPMAYSEYEADWYRKSHKWGKELGMTREEIDTDYNHTPHYEIELYYEAYLLGWEEK